MLCYKVWIICFIFKILSKGWNSDPSSQTITIPSIECITLHVSNTSVVVRFFLLDPLLSPWFCSLHVPFLDDCLLDWSAWNKTNSLTKVGRLALYWYCGTDLKWFFFFMIYENWVWAHIDCALNRNEILYIHTHKKELGQQW